MAEWSCSGLQSRVRRFDSDPSLHIEDFDSAATAAANGWVLYNGEAGWGWQNTNYAGGGLGEAGATTYTAGTQRWYADVDLGGELTFTEDWQASGRMDFSENSASDGGMFFGFFNRDTGQTAQTQTIAGFMLVNGDLLLRFERRPYINVLETAGFGLWVNDDRSFRLSYDADGGGPGIGRLTATLTRLADQTTITKSVDIDHSLVVGATLNSFGFYTIDFFPGRYTPVGWAVDDLTYGPKPQDGVPQLSSLSLSDAVVADCKTLTGTATLSAPAPAGGLTVTITDTLAAANTPVSVKARKGVTSANFVISTTPVSVSEDGTVDATLGGRTVSGSASLECKAAPGPILVELSSSMPEVAYPSVPSIVIPAGTQSGAFSVTTSPVSATTTLSISATANEVSASKTLTVSP